MVHIHCEHFRLPDYRPFMGIDEPSPHLISCIHVVPHDWFLWWFHYIFHILQRGAGTASDQ